MPAGGLRAVRAHRQPGLPVRPHRQARRQGLGRPARPRHGHRRPARRRRARSRSTCSARCTPRSATSTRSSASSRITSLVNSAPDFTEHHLVTNGCSELFGEVFAEQRRARAQRLRRRPAAARRLRRDRADRPGRRMRQPRSRRARGASCATHAPGSRSSPRSSFGAVGAALVSQHVFDMQPCPWCVLQRLIFVAIGAFAVLGLVWRGAGRRPRRRHVRAAARASPASRRRCGSTSSRRSRRRATSRSPTASSARPSSTACCPTSSRRARAAPTPRSSLFGVPYALWSGARLRRLRGRAAVGILRSERLRSRARRTVSVDAEAAPADIAATVATLFRRDSRKVLATLIRLLGDFDLAEEALQDAFRAAVEQWPRDGVPANPARVARLGGPLQGDRRHPPARPLRRARRRRRRAPSKRCPTAPALGRSRGDRGRPRCA